VDVILEHATLLGASDVHFEPAGDRLEVRYRLDGVLQPLASMPAELGPNLVARLKVLASLLTYRVDVPQEGRIDGAKDRYGVEIRVSTFPTVFGERAVARLFERAQQLFELAQLGLPPAIFRQLELLLHHNSGAILLTGPSGSGKTTTIYACLRHIVQFSGGQRHIMTIEDPVEQVLDGVTQSQVRPGSEFDFARGLRSLLRQDPEVIMIGEIRDRQTAATAIEAALTGHLVISTVHCGSACGVISRLMDMGVEPYLLTSGLIGVLNQRLVRRLCQCARQQRAEPDSERRSRAGPPDREKEKMALAGCHECLYTGYRSRTLLAELVTMDERLRQAILARADTKQLQQVAVLAGGLSIKESARQAVRQGLTTEAEIERVLGPELGL
jgi:type II secretory ATPase GspE/PulE/Tfp pilus assembly ATPase PilB-like protein